MSSPPSSGPRGWLQAGDQVQLHGLVSDEGLNGQHGVVEALPTAAGGRVQVRLVRGGAVVNVREANIRLRSAATAFRRFLVDLPLQTEARAALLRLGGHEAFIRERLAVTFPPPAGAAGAAAEGGAEGGALGLHPALYQRLVQHDLGTLRIERQEDVLMGPDAAVIKEAVRAAIAAARGGGDPDAVFRAMPQGEEARAIYNRTRYVAETLLYSDHLLAKVFQQPTTRERLEYVRRTPESARMVGASLREMGVQGTPAAAFTAEEAATAALAQGLLTAEEYGILVALKRAGVRPSPSGLDLSELQAALPAGLASAAAWLRHSEVAVAGGGQLVSDAGGEPVRRTCAFCHREEPRGGPAFQICGRCRRVHYCDAACQRRDWPGHRGVCEREPR